MKKRLFIVSAVVAFALLLVPGASAQTTPTPYLNTVGIMVDSIGGDTNTVINCMTEGSDGRFASDVGGDATLIMVNRTPHKIKCDITIKKN
jgi:hypothetical protein